VSLVLDASATFAWLLPAETTEAIREVFSMVETDGAVVPALWRLEVTNSLTMAARRKRIESAFRDMALVELAAYDIRVDQETDQHAWFETMMLADRFALTMYDAAYLELAQRRSLPLATLDRDLANAAKASGVAILGLPD
jgi:predicted nucleic acid-binding protein